MFRVCHVFLSVHCSLVVTCWELAGHLALLYVMFYYVFVTFPCGVLGQMCYFLIFASLLTFIYIRKLAMSSSCIDPGGIRRGTCMY